MNTKLDAKLKAKWVKALRSGRIEQAYSALKTVHGSMCCLGVLRHVANPKDERMGVGCNDELLSPKQLREFGLTHEIQKALAAELNDNDVPFDLIAGFIQENL